MTQIRKKWLISPNTNRKYAICIRCWSDGRFRHYVIERKSPNAILYEFFVDFLRSLIETFAEQGYESAERMFLIRLPILSVIMGILVFAKMYFVDFG